MLRPMPQSLANLVTHLVFSTKDRTAWFQDITVRNEVFHFLGGVSARLDCPTLIVGGHVDHIHLLGRMARTVCVADWVKELKRASSLWVKERFPALTHFHWQQGYGAFSVSQSSIPSVVRYIQHQDKHHARLSFQDEFRALLRRHGMAWDEKYVWD